MADIHLYTPDGETIVHPEERVAELKDSGALSPDTLFWREGMEEWKPIKLFERLQIPPARPVTQRLLLPEPVLEPDSGPPDAAGTTNTRLLPEVGKRSPSVPEAASAAEPKHMVGRNRFRFRRSPEPLTTIAQVILVVCLCITALELANAIVRYSSLSSGLAPMDDAHSLLAPPPHDNEATANEVSSVSTDGSRAFIPADEDDDTGRILEWLGWGANIAFIVPYFMWLYRTSQNCRNFSFIMRFKPEWAVACHFVPPMNLFRPCQVMQEIWRVSNNPRTWHNDRFSILVGIWWALTLGTGALALSSWLHAAEAETHAAQLASALYFIALKVVQLAWYSVFLALVTQIIQKQRLVVRRARRKAEQEGAE
jgi:hypothetical protein